MTILETVFLDAGGVLVFPNWHRISDTLRAHGVDVGADALAAAEPHAKRHLDQTRTIQATNDEKRGWLYFNLILERAGVTTGAATDAALAELHQYHQQFNLWEYMPPDVLPALRTLRGLDLRLVIVSNANGTISAAAERLGLTECVGCMLDSFVEKVEKPDPRFFEIALARSGARRETTIHVGDIYEVDVVGARAAGIRPVLLDAAGLYPEADCPRVQSLPVPLPNTSPRRELRTRTLQTANASGWLVSHSLHVIMPTAASRMPCRLPSPHRCWYSTPRRTSA